MSRDSKFTIQLLEKVGVPLMATIDKVAGEEEVESAHIMAQLLGQVTQISMKLYNMLEIEEAENQADSTRLALAALAAPLISGSYEHHKQVPTEEQIKRIEKSLEAVISFGENFSSADEHQSRLQTVGYDTVLFDKDQPSLVVLQAMVSVVNAVEEFSFGQSERKLVQDIATRLESAASDLAQKNGREDKLKELIIFKALAALYTSCHLAEIERISTKSESERGELSLDPVWEAFQTKLSMMEALLALEGQDSGVDQKAPNPEKTQTVSEAENKPQGQEAPSSGPMGFFKKGHEGGAETATPPAETVAQESSPAPVSPPTEEPRADSGGAPQSPMGFFKPGAQKKEENSDDKE